MVHYFVKIMVDEKESVFSNIEQKIKEIDDLIEKNRRFPLLF